MAKHNDRDGLPTGESDAARKQQLDRRKNHAGGTRRASGQAGTSELMVCRKNEQSAVTQPVAAAAVNQTPH